MLTCIVNFSQKVKKVLVVWNKFLFLHQLNSILLTVKIHKSWQLRKKLQKKLQRKPLLRRRKLQRRRNNFSFLEAKNIKSSRLNREDFFFVRVFIIIAETRSPPAFAHCYYLHTTAHFLLFNLTSIQLQIVIIPFLLLHRYYSMPSFVYSPIVVNCFQIIL